MLHVSLGEADCRFDLGFAAEKCHALIAWNSLQSRLWSSFFFCFIFISSLLGVLLVSRSCSTAEKALGLCVQNRGTRPNAGLSIAHTYGKNQIDPERRGSVMYNSRFQQGLSRWKQEMRSSDKHDTLCILCNKFIWMLSCCVYVQNLSPSNFRAAIYFIWHLYSRWLVPCGCRHKKILFAVCCCVFLCSN